MELNEIIKVSQILLKYLLPTLKLFGLTVLLSIPLGVVFAMLKMCKVKVVSWITNVYILVMRGTPLMLQIITVYYAIPMLATNSVDWLENALSFINTRSDNYLFGALLFAFVMNYAAYFAEIFRGGIESISQGQYEAATVLGFTKTQTFFKIILPQVIKVVVPACSNEVITLVKDTSLSSVIAYAEIFRKAREQMIAYSSLTPLFIAGVFYFVMNAVLTALFSFIEKKLDYYTIK